MKSRNKKDCVTTLHGRENLYHWWVKQPHGGHRCVRCGQLVRCEGEPSIYKTGEKLRAEALKQKRRKS